jgi:predicted transcriptional regulator
MRIMVTEKMALVCFPYFNGSIDCAPFHGSDPRFHRWVTDLYEHQWATAKHSSSTLLAPDT